MQENNMPDQVPPVPPDPTKEGGEAPAPQGSGSLEEVAKKIKEADNVLVALSNDPSVDEMAAAIGLTMALDTAGKHATAIYSGKTPNVLEFLNPEETFETNTDSLQDFIIALNKDKADHLRYKIDGDFVKVYITPYKTTIEEDDLEFSRGDYNIDLVVAINVPAATELDGALKEHGRIMHDATAINITNGAQGKFGDVEWVDPKASSISEMVTNLAMELNNKKLDAGIATALLTGLVAATDKFTNQATTPDVMMMAAKLMGFGADQQVVIQNISQELEFNEREDAKEKDSDSGEEKSKHNELTISHDEEEKEGNPSEENDLSADESSEKSEEKPEENAGLTGALASQMNEANNAPDPVQAAMASAMNPMGVPGNGAPASTTIAGVEVSSVSGDNSGYAGGALADQILNNMNTPAPTAQDAQGAPEAQPAQPATDYGQMIDQALAEPLPGETSMQPPMMAGQPAEASPATVVPDGGMPPAPMGAAMLNGAGVAPELGPNPTMLANPAGPNQDEIDALNIINQAKQGQEETPSLTLNGELPKIVPTGGSLGYDSPAAVSATGGTMMNPAMAQAPGVENMPAVNDAPNLNFGQVQGMGAPAGMPTEGAMPSEGMTPNEGTMAQQPMVQPIQAGMPMPGQELAPPPMTPTPDFGAMPPVQTNPTPMAPDMTQMAQQPMAQPTMPTPMAPTQDPGAFQIPGMQQ